MGRAASRCAQVVFLARIAFGLGVPALLFAGCGAPGEPTAPSPPIPVAVSDLSAHQQGDGVEVVFTVPSKTIKGARLTAPPAVEILRGTPEPDGSADAKSFRVVYTIPGALAANYISDGQVTFTDPVAREEIGDSAGRVFFYAVRTRLSQKRASADSNVVPVRLFPVPERISTLTTRVTEKAIELVWTAPPVAVNGGPVISSYNVYRGELDPNALEAARKDLAEAKWKSPLRLLASAEEAKYDDTFFDFGKTYAYLVRSVVTVEAKPLESSDSNAAIVTPQDTFPPAAPQNVAGNVVPGTAPNSALVDLSWSISPETDLAGYRVYRSEEQDTRGLLLTTDLLLAPAYRDTSVESGHRYWYTVTAVDRAGNESAASAAIAVDVAKP